MKTLHIPHLTRPAGIAIALALSLGMTLPFIAAPPPASADTMPVDETNPATPVTVSADALPTTQIDHVAWAQVIVGDTVYVAGDFSTARPAGAAPGVNTVPRNNLLAYNINTGVLVNSFAPSLNAQALAITASPDGSRIYVGGDFTAVNGLPAYRIVAISTATGQVISSFKPIMGSQVRALFATNTTVYAGGTFQSVNGQARKYLAQMNASDGSLTSWTADADDTVYSMTLTVDGSKLIVGGRFQNIGATARYGLAALDATTGSVLPWAIGNVVKDASTAAAIVSLHATADAVYGSGYVFGSTGNLEGIFSADPSTGNMIWIEDCHGDTVSTWPLGDAVYAVGHSHFCGNIGGFPQTNPWTMHHSIAFSKAATGVVSNNTIGGYYNWAGNPSPSLLDWFPNWIVGSYTGQGQASWSLTGNSNYIAAAGEFPYVNGVAQYGLTRFAIRSIAPNKVGPVVNDELIPVGASFNSGEVRLSWTATYDRDNTHLTYVLVRDNDTAHPVYTTTLDSTFWIRPTMGFIDRGLAPGSTHTYRLYVNDPWNNTISRLGAPVTVASTNSGGAYSDAVGANSPDEYWPLNESSGSVGFDHIGFNDLAMQPGVTRGAAGPVAGATASTFSGDSTGFGATQTAITGPNTFTAESWIRTNTTNGGKIIGFGAANTGNSSSYDRQVYMDNAGHIWFGVYPGGVQTVTSSGTFNDGAWHQIVASLGANGMRLYVDGNLVGSRTDVTTGQAYSGYWRVGGDNLSGWPSRPSSDYFTGDIAQVAIYPTVLSRTDVINHWVASGRTSPLPPAPSDAYGAAVYNLNPDIYWRLDDSTGTTMHDSGPNQADGDYAGAVTEGGAGAIPGAGTSVAFNGGTASSRTAYVNPTTYSLETWFKTTTTSGGKLIGFGDQRSALSNNYDRHVYMQNDGTLVFGVWTGQTNTITTPLTYNNGQWHYVVATQSVNGMMLYVDGVLVGTNPQTAAQAYTGYWRIGGDNTWGSTSPYFAGSLDEVAVYPTALTGQDVANHYALGTTGTLPNQLPTAAFSSVVTNLSVAFDASASADPDGTIASYAWTFGDGQTATGATPTHVYSDAGDHSVTLTVTDNLNATGSVTHTVTTTAPPVNLPPVAAFRSVATNLSVAFDASGSTDPDGTIASYAWLFGDGQTGTGSNPSHTYGSAGNYTVTLTVTDNSSATNAVSHPVTVSVTTGNVIAQDAFTRTLTGGWGSAGTGGAWSLGGAASSFSVASGSGNITVPAGSTRTATLSAVSSTDTNLQATVAFGAVPTGGGAYANLIGRQVGSSFYIADIWVKSTGAVMLVVKQGSTVLGTVPVSGITYTPGMQLQVRFQVTGTSPTMVRAKVWPTGQTEPSAWLASYSDSTAALQSAGSIALQVYLSGSATAPVTASFSNLLATSSTPPPANQSPTASFTSSVSNLTVSVNGGGSSDPDGTIASYAWNFGDGQTGTGVTASHSYAAAGNYTVTLTVTDNQSATGSATQTVTVTAPPAGVVAQDDFNTAIANGWGVADVGGTWTVAGSAAAYQAVGGFGQISVAAGSTKTALLAGVSSTATNLSVSFTADQTSTGGGIYVTAIGRNVGSNNYQARVWLQSTGAMHLQLMQGSTIMQNVIVAGLTYTPGSTYQLRLVVSGTSPTTIQAKVWADGATEPAAWQASVTDTTAALQVAGGVGLGAYVSASATAVPVAIRFDNLLVSPTP